MAHHASKFDWRCEMYSIGDVVYPVIPEAHSSMTICGFGLDWNNDKNWLRCIWFDAQGKLQEAVYSNKYVTSQPMKYVVSIPKEVLKAIMSNQESVLVIE
jgi:hypothetical protein